MTVIGDDGGAETDSSAVDPDSGTADARRGDPVDGAGVPDAGSADATAGAGEDAYTSNPVDPPLTEVDPGTLQMESGEVEPLGGGAFGIVEAEVRAIALDTLGKAAEISFTYRGPSAESSPFASGEVQRQIGLKLRAQNTCNVVYVIWEITPKPGIWVSVKANPGQSTHSECSDHGYLSVNPQEKKAVPTVAANAHHMLSARIEGNVLRAFADSTPVWSGTLPREAFRFDGPAGIRSDNGKFELKLRALPKPSP